VGRRQHFRAAESWWGGVAGRNEQRKSLSLTLGAGQRPSDANHVRYRIRTSATNSHGGVLIYGLTLKCPEGDQFTPQNASQQVTVTVGAGQ